MRVGGVNRPTMVFVDGENLTMRGQKVADENGIQLLEGPCFMKDCFIWFRVSHVGATIPFNHDKLIRAYYFTSFVGDGDLQTDVETKLRNLDFTSQVFKRSKTRGSKGVDIALCKEMLSHAFRGNYENAVLVAGDGDYVPLVEEVQRLGKTVQLLFFDNGLNAKLRLAADAFIDATELFLSTWRRTP